MKAKYKDRYVLATGYPWALGTDPYTSVEMNMGAKRFVPVHLNFPKELWQEGCPRYRLVLERVK